METYFLSFKTRNTQSEFYEATNLHGSEFFHGIPIKQQTLTNSLKIFYEVDATRQNLMANTNFQNRFYHVGHLP